jgi:hypothetical protein
MDSGVVSFYDKEYHLLGIEDDAQVVYTSKWNTYNSFEIYLKSMKDYVKTGNRIIWDNDGRKNGIITYIKYDDVEDTVTIRGYSLLYLLSQRITVPDSGQAQQTYSGAIEDVMYALVKKNATDAGSLRSFPRMTCEESQGRGIKVAYNTRYDNLLDNLTDLSKYSMVGIGVRVVPADGKEIFEVRFGTDHSISQTDNSQVVFRQEYDNITTETYEINTENYKNTAYTAGQGEGVERAVYIVGDSNVGEDRNEVFVDARDIEDASELPTRGETKLADYTTQESFVVTANADEFGKRWDIGDKITVISSTVGVQMDTYVTEVEETLDSTGYSVEPTFGNKTKTIGDTTTNSNSSGSEISSKQ